MFQIQIKRIYEKYDKKDGFRVLIDGLWPRGIKKEEAKIDLWMKEIAPSTELRKWFNHKPEKWPEFRKKYREELKNKMRLIKDILHLLHQQNVTLLLSAKEPQFNNAVVLKEWIEEQK